MSRVRPDFRVFRSCVGNPTPPYRAALAAALAGLGLMLTAGRLAVEPSLSRTVRDLRETRRQMARHTLTLRKLGRYMPSKLAPVVDEAAEKLRSGERDAGSADSLKRASRRLRRYSMDLRARSEKMTRISWRRARIERKLVPLRRAELALDILAGLAFLGALIVLACLVVPAVLPYLSPGLPAGWLLATALLAAFLGYVEYVQYRTEGALRWGWLAFDLFLAASPLLGWALYGAYVSRGRGSRGERRGSGFWARLLCASAVPGFLLAAGAAAVLSTFFGAGHITMATVSGLCGLAALLASTGIPSHAEAVFGDPGWEASRTPEGRILGALFSRRAVRAAALVPAYGLAWLALLLIVLSAASLLVPLIPFLGPGWRSAWAIGAVWLASAVLFTVRADWGARLGACLGIRDQQKAGGKAKAAKPAPGRALRPALQLAALLAAAWGAMFLSHRVWHGTVTSLKARLRAEGRAVSMAEFHRDIPERDNAFVYLKRTNGDIDLGRLYKVEPWRPAAAVWDSETYRERKELLAHYREDIEKRSAGLRRFNAYSGTDFLEAASDPLGARAPRYGSVIGFSRLLMLTAPVHAVEGRPGLSWKTARTQLRLAELVAQDRWLIGQMIGSALREYAATTALHVMLIRPENSMPEDVAGRLGKLLAREAVTTGFGTDLAWILDMQAQERDPKTSGMDWAEGGGLSSALWRAAAGMGCFDAAISAYAENILRLSDFRSWKEYEAARNAAQGESERLPLWPYFAARAMIPRFGWLRVRELETKTWIKMTLAVSGMARFREARGRYPRELPELTAFVEEEVLRDPYTGDLLGYSPDADGKGFTLWSAGPEGDRLAPRKKRKLELRLRLDRPKIR